MNICNLTSSAIFGLEDRRYKRVKDKANGIYNSALCGEEDCEDEWRFK